MTAGPRLNDNEAMPLRVWVDHIIKEFGTKWTSARGLSIATTLRTMFASRRIVFEALNNPERAVYRNSGEIAVFVHRDARMAKLYRQRKWEFNSANKGGWLISGDDYMIERASLVLSLAHEGLHAVQKTPGAGSLEEEVDGRLAGNAGAKAIGLLPAQRLPVSAAGLAQALAAIKPDYPTLPGNPAYAPLGSAWPAPWVTDF